MGIMNLKVEEGEAQLDPEPTREVCARYRNVIMSDKEKYDGASIDEVADHFTDWADDPNNDQSSNINMNVCLLIDEEVLHWLRDAPPATTEVRTTGNADQNVCIKVIDTLFDPEDMSECDPRYRGWASATDLSRIACTGHSTPCTDGASRLNGIATETLLAKLNP
ncbi:hypothetical protein V501_06696 [Pseudogymnoascus sp. VKM F-4519 (FW-2642)]|nr:hypothetical protein V501_06696 [Pseudogymnoascus sp. VKM F-4519 (FW-2642)]